MSVRIKRQTNVPLNGDQIDTGCFESDLITVATEGGDTIHIRLRGETD